MKSLWDLRPSHFIFLRNYIPSGLNIGKPIKITHNNSRRDITDTLLFLVASIIYYYNLLYLQKLIKNSFENTSQGFLGTFQNEDQMIN